MPISNARFETEHGSKYLQQLCKHFAHKVDAQFDETTGRADLPGGSVELTAEAGGLAMQVIAQDADGLHRAEFILEDHLKRFAFREDPKPLEWVRS